MKPFMAIIGLLLTLFQFVAAVNIMKMAGGRGLLLLAIVGDICLVQGGVR